MRRPTSETVAKPAGCARQSVPPPDLELVPPAAFDDDRLQRRRRATLEEILEVSLEVMREEGVGGLTLAEVARRIGVKPPSLYKHVDSKQAIYDALFAAGTRAHRAAIEDALSGHELSLETVAKGFEASVRWCVEHPTLAQLLYWRPVPGFEPSPEAFEPAKAADQWTREVFAELVSRGELRPEAASDAGMALFTCLISGLITQQIATEPDARFEEGRFTRHTRDVFALFVERFHPGARVGLCRRPHGHPRMTSVRGTNRKRGDMRITRQVVVLDAADVAAVSQFWAGVLGGHVVEDDNWHSVLDSEGEWRMGVQFAPDHIPPSWPGSTPGQQLHLDLWVEDIESAHAEVMALGARVLQEPEETDEPDRFRVYADPAGHPFCLCWVVGS